MRTATACLLVFLGCSTSATNLDHQLDKNTCLKPACIDAASEIQQNIDPSIQPCDDFYSFACGGFFQKTVIPANKRGFDIFNNLSSLIDEQAKIMLEEGISETGSKSFKLVKKLFDACTNTAAIEREGLQSINHYLNEFGGWSLLKHHQGKSNEEHDWMELSSKLRKLGFGDYLLSLYVEADPRNESRRILIVAYPHLVVRKDWNDEELVAYRNYLTNVAVSLGANRDTASQQFEESSSFELHLANIQGVEQERGMTIRELEFNYPGIPWLQFINYIVNDDGDGLTYDDAVIVKSPQFILNLIQLIKFSSKRTLENYLISRAVTSMVPYTTSALRNEDLTFRKTLHSATEYDPRWKECSHVVSGRLHVATAAMYARKYFGDSKLNVATEIANGVQSEFAKLLSKITWMDDATKEYAQKKLEDMTKTVGFPKELLNNHKIDDYYSLLNLVDTTSYLHLIKQIDLFNIDRHYKQLQKAIGEDTWAEQSHTNSIAAFYNPRKNTLQFPAGLLQEPFFDSERPHYMNYGSLGSLIGHEIVHAFDNQGKHYDEYGGIDNWWSPRTESDYSRATRCINEYYSNAGVPEIGLNVNNLNSQDEIIADIAGVKQAYLAYQNWVQNNPTELPLPGLNYTQNQLFWISTASVWCSKYNNDNGEQYSPGSYRVYEAFRNLEEFSKDYDCAIGSNMNPETKCVIW